MGSKTKKVVNTAQKVKNSLGGISKIIKGAGAGGGIVGGARIVKELKND